jgi:hypothetical protein
MPAELDEFDKRIRKLELRAQAKEEGWPDAGSLPVPLPWPEPPAAESTQPSPGVPTTS